MTTATTLSADDFVRTRAPVPTRRLRLLRGAQTPKAPVRLTDATPPQPPVRREAWLLVLLALGLHALVVVGLWSRTDAPRKARFSQEMELLRAEPQATPEPPKPTPPPPKRLEPPKAMEPPKPAPQPVAALRTAPAEAPVANTLTVAENLTAAKSTGPVVAAPPAPPPKVEEPVTEANGAAAYLNNPPPVYPKTAQRLGLQGRVLLRVQVLASGHVGALEIKQSSGKAVLDEAALAAVKDWVFTPAKRGSTPIDGWTHVPIEFRFAS